jgi:23S rRNA (cytidine1920-2'-O)/16S rRNA (cytidine1409-2'-O)-methyltransferase
MNNKLRLDQALVVRGMVLSRSQADNYIKLGEVRVEGTIETRPGRFVTASSDIKLTAPQQYVSRAALKLSSVAATFGLEFKNKIVLDVGSSTGGFSEFALRHGAKRLIAVDVGTGQMHHSLRGDKRVDLYEQTDIRKVKTRQKHRDNVFNKLTSSTQEVFIKDMPDTVLIDVSFISLREILPHLCKICRPKTEMIAMVKPQFEAGTTKLKHKGVIKNDRVRREIMKSFENWVTNYCIIEDKADSKVAGARGNLERFYKLRSL